MKGHAISVYYFSGVLNTLITMDTSTNGNSEEHALEWGETVNCPKENHEFVYTCTVQQEKCVLRIPFTLPMKESTRELMYRIIASHNVPCYVHNGMTHRNVLMFF